MNAVIDHHSLHSTPPISSQDDGHLFGEIVGDVIDEVLSAGGEKPELPVHAKKVHRNARRVRVACALRARGLLVAR